MKKLKEKIEGNPKQLLNDDVKQCDIERENEEKSNA